MDIATARALAHEAHYGQLTRHHDRFTEHLERVAASVPPDAQVLAFLHDLLEHTDLTLDELTAAGMSQVERDALLLLTRGPDESYELHTLRIAYAHGPAGALARTVKLADLDDHLRSRRVDPAPPYAWARRHLVVARDRADGGGIAEAA